MPRKVAKRRPLKYDRDVLARAIVDVASIKLIRKRRPTLTDRRKAVKFYRKRLDDGYYLRLVVRHPDVMAKYSNIMYRKVMNRKEA